MIKKIFSYLLVSTLLVSFSSMEARSNKEEVSPDDLLASDFNVLAKPANLFRFRVDERDFVIDFGNAPPIIEKELTKLKKESINVHTRITIPRELAKSVAETMLETINSLEKEPVKK